MTTTRILTRLAIKVLLATLAVTFAAVHSQGSGLTDFAPHDPAQVEALQEKAKADTIQATAELIESQVPDSCSKTPKLTDTILVRNNAKDKAGHIQFDTAVVYTMTFKQAEAAAQAGKVWILAYC